MFDHMMRRDPIGERERSTSPFANPATRRINSRKNLLPPAATSFT